MYKKLFYFFDSLEDKVYARLYPKYLGLFNLLKPLLYGLTDYFHSKWGKDLDSRLEKTK